MTGLTLHDVTVRHHGPTGSVTAGRVERFQKRYAKKSEQSA